MVDVVVDLNFCPVSVYFVLSLLGEVLCVEMTGTGMPWMRNVSRRFSA